MHIHDPPSHDAGRFIVIRYSFFYNEMKNVKNSQIFSIFCATQSTEQDCVVVELIIFYIAKHSIEAMTMFVIIISLLHLNITVGVGQ